MSMQLDDYRIAIRERNYLDLLDLALRVVRAHALPLLAAFVVGVAPFLLLNAWLLSDSTEPHFELGFPVDYVFWMLWLVVWQIPLATAPITLYLGHALFNDQPDRARLAGGFFAALPQMILYQLILRGVLMLPMITVFLIFWGWPYLSEVILLERNPLFRGSRRRITTLRRTRSLHGGSTGDLLARWMGATAVAAMLLTSIWFTLWLLGGLLAGDWPPEGIFFTIYFPLALWGAIGYLTVVRFLSYLDLRIRREGWEVELLMRAEGNRLTRQTT
jgi:hypothetical protein